MDNDSQAFPPIPDKQEIKTAKNLSFAKTLSYGFVIVSVGVSIAIGGYLLGVSKTKPQPAIQTSVTPFVSPTPDPTANWQTYANADFDIEFNHPLGWDVAQTFDVRTPTLVVGLQEKIDYLKKVNFQVGGGVAPIGILKDNSINIPSSDSSKTVTSRAITIGGVNAIEYTTTWKVDLPGVGAGDVTISTHIKNASTKYVVNLNNISYREIYNQILSTFKFTDQNQAESIDSWRTYTNKTYGFEMKYPKEYAYLENSIEPKINIVYFDAPANIKGNPSIILSVDKDPQTLLFQGTFNTVPQPKADNAKLVSSGNININGVSFKKDYWKIRDSIIAVNYYTKWGNNYFTASLGLSINGADKMNNNELLKAISKDKKSIIFDQMLSTFKFTN